MMPDYRYRCRDQAVLLAPFKRYVVRPAARFLPPAVPANALTVGASLFLLLALYRSCLRSPSDTLDFLLIPLCLFCYVLGDHLDGFQAKRAGILSPLGEFCDHGLDAIHTGVLLFLPLRLYAVDTPWVAAFVLSCAYLAHATVFYEQYRTGWLIFEPLSSLEGVFLTMAVILAGAYPPVRQALAAPVWMSLSPAALLLLGSGVGALGTCLRSLRRLNGVSSRYGIYIGALALIGLFAASFLEPPATFVLITAYGAHYALGSMRGHLVDGREHGPGLLLPLAIAGLILVHALGADRTAAALPFLMVGQGCLLAGRAMGIVRSLRRRELPHSPAEVREI